MKALLIFLCMMFPAYPHTQADIDLLADVMWLENGHTGLNEEDNRQCLILTGSVVLNRVKSGKWGGKTIKSVVYSKGQYAYETTSQIGKTDTPQWVKDLARDMLIYGTNVPDYVIYQSQQPGLGTVWKIIENGKKDEYFATSGGHKHEGDDFVATVNCDSNTDLWGLIDFFRSTDYGKRLGTGKGNRRRLDSMRFISTLALPNLLGGGQVE